MSKRVPPRMTDDYQPVDQEAAAAKVFGWCIHCDERHAMTYECQAERDFREANESEAMYPSPSRHIRVVQHLSSTHTALCVDDKCPWKYRGITAAKTWMKAEGHTIQTAHRVKLYTETVTTMARKSTGGQEG